MQKTVYENYKYSLQDTAKVYICLLYTSEAGIALDTRQVQGDDRDLLHVRCV